MRLALIALLCLASFAHAQDVFVPAKDAVAKLQLPKGFQATLFAGEPDLVQPISFTFDDRGRMWVVECLSYPQWITEGEGKDRVSIFEDKDGDGTFDTKTVFFDKGTNLSSLQLGFGGVWLCAVPNLIFIPDRNGDDVPDSPPEVRLDGWDLKAKHNVVNELKWAPDGWLHGCNGILSNSKVGAPGTPDEERVSLNCGVWRYHPISKKFEVVAWGTTNPWGLDFDDNGEAFITNCVIHHLWHVTPGARFQRMFGQDLNPNAYGLIPSVADYIHWGGGEWTTSRGGQGVHDKPGGGHAHSGAMVYLGDNWPDEYRNRLFTCNIHGRRVNSDKLVLHGSGYKAERAPDFLFSSDPWFRGLALHTGPDGGVYVSDWNDTGECHDYEDVERDTGRIFKITYGKPARAGETVDLAALSDAELAKLQLHKNDWHVRHARRLLAERAAAGRLTTSEATAVLLPMLKDNPDVTRRLRALWALAVIDVFDAAVLSTALKDENARVRAWAVRLEIDRRDPNRLPTATLLKLAETDPSPRVRLALASGLQRLPVEECWPLAEVLVRFEADAVDPNLPLMLWYGLERLVAAEPQRAVDLIAKTRVPKIREYLARRVAGL